MTKKKIILAILIVAVVIAAVWFGIAHFSEKDEGLAFSFTDGSGCPEGWQVVSYAYKYTCSVSDGAVILHSDTADNLRIMKIVPCEGSTVYVLSGYMRAEDVSESRGVTLSVDNYFVDSSCAYSESLSGTTDWVYTRPCRSRPSFISRCVWATTTSSAAVPLRSVISRLNRITPVHTM